MRVYEIDPSKNGLARLSLKDRPDPQPGPGEVLIRIRAAALNYRDLLVVNNASSDRRGSRLVPVSDACGEVVQVGAGVRELRRGDRVISQFYLGWVDGQFNSQVASTALGDSDMDGLLAEYVVLPERGLVRPPDYLTDEEAATLPCAGLTAWSGLTSGEALRPDKTILLIGTGGVAIMALQLAHAAGARSIIVSDSDEKLERARALGAWATINRSDFRSWEEEVLRLTGGRGVDLTMESVGPATLNRSIRATRFAGQISLFGVITGFSGEVNTFEMLAKRIRLQGINVGSRRDLLDLCSALESTRIRPVVDRIYRFEEAVQAFHDLAEGVHFGKIAIRVSA